MDKNNNIVFSFVGDVMIGDSPLLIGRGVNYKIKKLGLQYYAKRLKELTNDCDFNFANLECVASNINKNILLLHSVELRGNPKNLSLFKAANWNIVNIANNHIFQHGIKAFNDTIYQLQKMNINVIGIENDNKTKPVIVSKNGLNFIIVGYSLHYEQYRPNENIPYSLRENTQAIYNEIEDIRNKYNGFLICSLHWGHEFVDEPSLSQIKFAHKLVDLGVDVIVGHHPHILQAIEKYKNSIIAYSLGNFIFDMNLGEMKKTVILKLKFNKTGICDINIEPLIIKNSYLAEKVNVSLKEELMSELNNKFYNLRYSVSDEFLSEKSKINYKSFKKVQYMNFFRYFYLYNLNYFFQAIIRALLRRLHLIRDP